MLQSETETPAYKRAREVVRKLRRGRASAISPRSRTTTAGSSSATPRRCSALTRSADAVPPLQSLLRRSDARVLRQAVAALAGIDDPAAARAIQTVLRAATGENRAAVVDALVAERDPRVVPMLARILADSDPFGEDHETVLDTLDAVRQLANEQAVGADRHADEEEEVLSAQEGARVQDGLGAGAARHRHAAGDGGARRSGTHRRPPADTPDRPREAREAGMSKNPDELVRRLAAGLRAAELYAPQHPLVQRSVQALRSRLRGSPGDAATLVVGFIGDDVVVNDTRLGKGSASLTGFVRGLRDREIEKITFHRGVTAEEIQTFLERDGREARSRTPLVDRLASQRCPAHRHRQARRSKTRRRTQSASRRRARSTAPRSRRPRRCGIRRRRATSPIRRTARKIIDSLANIVNQDRTSLMALTALKKYDNYTFTHMVNVAALSMAQARALNLEGPLLREFGFAALMHDIGKVNTPLEVLNKPGKLDRGRIQDDEAARRRRRAHPAAHARDAGARARSSPSSTT